MLSEDHDLTLAFSFTPSKLKTILNRNRFDLACNWIGHLYLNSLISANLKELVTKPVYDNVI